LPLGWSAASDLAEHLDLGPEPATALDLAAGSAVFSIPLALRTPHLKVTAIDWPLVLDVTRQVTKRYGVADRYDFVPGDLATAAFGTGHRVALLGQILHSEGEARSRALLRRTFEALAPGGIIAIAEFLVDDDRCGPPTGLIFALNMLVHTDEGGTYSPSEIGGWLREAGFADVRLLSVPAPSPLILATKPR
jgi:O-methyltransferase domain